MRQVTASELFRKDPSLKILWDKAKEARLKAAAYHSNFQVGAAIRLQSGEEFSGCNVENASYGGTICAERTAITKACSEVGLMSGSIVEVMVVTDLSLPSPPCGVCRSMLANFDTEGTRVYCANLDGSVIREFTSGELLPHSFEREFAALLAKK